MGAIYEMKEGKRKIGAALFFKTSFEWIVANVVKRPKGSWKKRVFMLA